MSKQLPELPKLKESGKPLESDSSELDSSESITKIKKEKVLSDYLLDLKVISKIKAFNKLIVRDEHINIDDTYFQSVKRYFNNDSREITINYINEINLGIEKEIQNILSNYDQLNNLRDTPSNLLINISQNLNLATGGLRNLIVTYGEDNFNKSKLELVIDDFQLKINKISEFIELKKK